MATTFSPNIGSESLGGFSAYAVTTDDYVVAFFANMTTGEVINVPDDEPGEQAYATTLSANQLAALSTNLKGLLAAAIASGADPTSDPLAYLRKLVGFVALNDGQTLTYSTSNFGDYEEFYVELVNQPGTVMMYLPNSASAGLFTGSGSDEASGGGGGGGAQRYDGVANIPGLYLPGVASLVVPNSLGGNADITLLAVLTNGYAQTGATLQRDFIVEKINMAVADPGVGLGTLMMTIRFNAGGAAGNAVAGLFPEADLVVPAGWLYRLVNPAGADATLANVAITIGASVPAL